eukprot:4785467-Prymnesium_polylepis.1
MREARGRILVLPANKRLLVGKVKNAAALPHQPTSLFIPRALSRQVARSRTITATGHHRALA